MTDDDVNDMVRRLAMAFGVAAPNTVIEEMVTRFLTWKLPSDFAPDAGIYFEPGGVTPNSPLWPIGTNLLTSAQARAMVLHMLGLSA